MSVRRHGSYVAVAAFTYGISALWQRSMVSFKGPQLKIGIWDRTPPFPGAYSIAGEPRGLQRRTYMYGFLPPASSAWLADATALSGLTSEELANALFQDVMQRPKRDPFFYLTERDSHG